MTLISRSNSHIRLRQPRGSAFITLFTLDSLSRATLVTVVPLQAYTLLGDVQKVSLLYVLVSALGLSGSLLVPWLVRLLHYHRTLIFGCGCMITAAMLLSMQALTGLFFGIALQTFGGATVAICLNLYVQEYIPRQEFSHFEPLRITSCGAAWLVGPALGVFLGSYVAVWLPYVAAAGVSLIQLF